MTLNCIPGLEVDDGLGAGAHVGNQLGTRVDQGHDVEAVPGAVGFVGAGTWESQQFQFLREVDDGALPVLPRAEGRVAALLAAELRVPVEDVLAASQEVAGLSGVHGLSGGGKHNSFGTHL